jgi:predicted transcriptional regulator
MFGEFCLGNYRGRLDIIAEILDVASRDAKKTQIMYQANLSYKVLQKYLAEVVGASLVRFADEKHCYELTDKGRRYLEAYEKYSRTHRHVEKRLNDVETKKKSLEDLCSGNFT